MAEMHVISTTHEEGTPLGMPKQFVHSSHDMCLTQSKNALSKQIYHAMQC